MFAALQHEQLSVRWDNFHTSLSQDLGALLREGEMVDVTLVADGQVLRAHRLVLALGSPYFKDVLKVDPGQHPIVILKDVGYQELANVVEFMYRGEVSVRSTGLEAFLRVAEALRVKGLTEDGAFQVPTAARTRETPTTAGVGAAACPPVKRARTVSPDPRLGESQAPPAVTTEPAPMVKMEPTPVVKNEPMPDVSCDVYVGEEECYNQSSDVLFQDASGAQSNRSPTSSSSQFPQEISRGNFSFVQSRIGTPQLVHDDFIFKTHCTKGNKVYWQCTDYKKHKCRARAMTEDGHVTVMCAQHTHDPHTSRIQGRNRYQCMFYE